MDDDGEYEIEDAPPLTIDVKPEVVIIPSDDDDDIEHVDDDRSSTPSSRRSRKKRRFAAHDEVMLSSDDELEETATVARRRPVMDCGVWRAEELPSEHTMFEKTPGDDHVLLVVTGSVAAIKLAPLVETLRVEHNKRNTVDGQLLSTPTTRSLHIRCVLTESACHFVTGKSREFVLHLPEQTVRDLLSAYNVLTYRDVHEYQLWSERGDPVLHVELATWADLICIAPLSAHSMARLTAGLCDDLAQCVLRACPDSTPTLFAPAMNTHMWESPLTRQQVDVLEKQLGYTMLPVVSKTLMCGAIGPGAMAETDTIAHNVVQQLYSRRR